MWEGLGFFNNFRSCIIKVVRSLDLGSIACNSLCGFKVGKFDLDSSSKRSSRADKDICWLKIEVDLSTPVDVVKGIQNLSCNLADQILSVRGAFSDIRKDISGWEGSKLEKSKFFRGHPELVLQSGRPNPQCKRGVQRYKKGHQWMEGYQIGEEQVFQFQMHQQVRPSFRDGEFSNS